jgi:hypothetical protein
MWLTTYQKYDMAFICKPQVATQRELDHLVGEGGQQELRSLRCVGELMEGRWKITKDI